MLARVNRFVRGGGVLVLALAASACSGDDGTGGGSSPGRVDLPARTVVTADFLERSLSVFDRDRLVAGDSAEAALVTTVELAGYAPGPLQVELAPDGDTAVVAVGPGFFQGLGVVFGFPADIGGGGAVLIVSLSERAVRSEIATAQPPMGLAISPDGTLAYSANYGDSSDSGNTLSVIDLELGSLLDEVEVGGRPEQVTLNADGSIGALNVAAEGSVKLFATSDPGGTLSAGVATSDDPSDVAFVGDTLVVGESRAPSGYSVIDATDPSAPVLLETVDLDGGIAYAATALPGTTRALVGIATSVPAQLVEVDVGSSPSTSPRTIDLGNGTASFPLGAAVSPDGGHAFVALPVSNELAIVDLGAGTARRVTWLEGTGPTYAALGGP